MASNHDPSCRQGAPSAATRHNFSCVVPEGEASAGQSVAMIVLNENAVVVQAGGETVTWLRCKPAIT